MTKIHSADIIIIGGGAAGLMAAAGAAATCTGRYPEAKVKVLEKMPRPGRKIMITGKGRCNFTNMKPWNEFSGHIHPKPNFLKPAFYNLSSEKMVDFLLDNGMESVIERGDRAFPASHLASDVVDALVRAFNISSIPALLYIPAKSGEPVMKVGLKDADRIRSEIREVLNVK